MTTVEAINGFDNPSFMIRTRIIDVSNDNSTGNPSGVKCEFTSKYIFRENPNKKTVN